MTRRFMKVLVLLLCSVFTAATFAQNSNSSIRGTVEDTSGAVVPGATVVLTNVGTNQELTTTSKGDGFYNFTNLSPANYKISVTGQGFAQYIGVLTLRVSQSAEVDPKLTAASVSTQVTVHDVTPVIDRVDPTISDVKNSTAIETLPVQNRNILNVLAFSPGVVAGNYGGSGAGFTRVNGVPGGSVDYLVDGQTMSNRFTNTLQSNPQPTPTFQEVKIITANGDAQYGMPGVVELVTKSGTNSLHGQIYELNQNNHLAARPGFNGNNVPYLQHNEFGAQVGGPVWIPKIYNGRNRTFFFFDYEGIRENANKPTQYQVPTLANRGLGAGTGADLSDLKDGNGAPVTIYDPNTTTGPLFTRTAFAGNIIPTNRLNPVTQKILNPNFGLPAPNVNTGPVYSYNPNYEPTQNKATIDNNLYTGKVDQLFGPNRLAMRYTYTKRANLTPSNYFLLNPNTILSGGHNGSLQFTEILGPHAINVVHVGIQYNHNFQGPRQISPNIPSQINAGLPAGLALPTYANTVGWPGFYFYSQYQANATDTYWSNISGNNPKDYPDQTVSVGDQFALNHGNHQLLFGFDGSNSRVNYFETGQPGGNYNSGGNFTALMDPTSAQNGIFDVNEVDTGSGLADFLLGEGREIFVNQYPHLRTRQTQLAGYAQDNWRVTQRLTLNLGLRYSYWTPFKDAANVQSTFNPNVAGGLIVYAGNGLPGGVSQAELDVLRAPPNNLPIESASAAGYPTTLWNMPKNNFEPRTGFAYQLTPVTVLRGGWGIYQFAMPLVYFQQQTRGNTPFNTQHDLQPGEVNGVQTDSAAAMLEFPIATDNYGGPHTNNLNYFMYGTPTWQLDLNTVQQSQGFQMTALDPNYKLPTVQEYSLTMAQELPQHVGFELSYIGNHSTHLLQGDNINTEIPRDNCPAAGLPTHCTDPQRRPYPTLASGLTYYKYNGYSNTNELQARVQHTFGNGLLLQTSYTWQRTLTTTESGAIAQVGSTANIIPAALTPGYNLAAPTTSGAPYSERQRAVYAPDSNLPAKTFQLNAHYELPFGQGKRFLGNSHGIVNALVSGYNLSPFFVWHSGLFFAPYYSNGGSSVMLAPGKTGILPESQRTRAHWFDGSEYNPQNAGGLPYAGQSYIQVLGTATDFRNNIPRNYMTGPGFNRMDLTVYKLTPIYKNLVLDFEAQALNVYNHVNLTLPHFNPAANITKSLAGVGGTFPPDVPRIIQLQAKIIF